MQHWSKLIIMIINRLSTKWVSEWGFLVAHQHSTQRPFRVTTKLIVTHYVNRTSTVRKLNQQKWTASSSLTHTAHRHMNSSSLNKLTSITNCSVTTASNVANKPFQQRQQPRSAHWNINNSASRGCSLTNSDNSLVIALTLWLWQWVV